jgi:hypothetical protein
MTNATLSHFQAIAEAMNTEPTNWQWIGPHMSQRMFGITEARAKAYAERHGGTASVTDPAKLHWEGSDSPKNT